MEGSIFLPRDMEEVRLILRKQHRFGETWRDFTNVKSGVTSTAAGAVLNGDLASFIDNWWKDVFLALSLNKSEGKLQSLLEFIVDWRKLEDRLWQNKLSFRLGLMQINAACRIVFLYRHDWLRWSKKKTQSSGCWVPVRAVDMQCSKRHCGKYISAWEQSRYTYTV